MSTYRLFFCLLMFCLFSFQLAAQTTSINTDIAKGNKLYKSQQYPQAENIYRKALSVDSINETAKFNLAAALVKQNKKEEAGASYNKIIATTKDNQLLAQVWYNKGVLLSGEEKLQESIAAYKNSLRHNPNDKQARENLQKALLQLKKKRESPSKDYKPKPQQSKLRQQEADRKLNQLQQKEKLVQDKVQKEKTKGSGSQSKDW